MIFYAEKWLKLGSEPVKSKRQSKIIELINKYDIETQDELAQHLSASGFDVTQATISRDIKELNLAKSHTHDGKQKYYLRTREGANDFDRMLRVFNEGIRSIDHAQNMIVLKTHNGMAMAVAAAVDNMTDSNVLGSIAGDDTIFLVVRNTSSTAKIIKRLRNYQNRKE